MKKLAKKADAHIVPAVVLSVGRLNHRHVEIFLVLIKQSAKLLFKKHCRVNVL